MMTWAEFRMLAGIAGSAVVIAVAMTALLLLAWAVIP
jgi:hypothetical protein